MVAINWDSSGKRTYEAGLDRVVLYTYGSPGVPWSGLQSVEEDSEGGEIQSYYIDGEKYLLLSGYEEYGATLSAVNYPEEFASCNGEASLAKGLIATQQQRTPFSLVYRTLQGSDTKPLGDSYKLHLVYNATTTPSDRTHTSTRDEPTMERFLWSISTKPIPYPGVKPISHLVVDSSEANKEALALLESYLYGTNLYGTKQEDPMLLTPDQVAAVLMGEEVDFYGGNS